MTTSVMKPASSLLLPCCPSIKAHTPRLCLKAVWKCQKLSGLRINYFFLFEKDLFETEVMSEAKLMLVSFILRNGDSKQEQATRVERNFSRNLVAAGEKLLLNDHHMGSCLAYVYSAW